MNTKSAREVANIIKKEPWSVLIILAVVSLSFIFDRLRPHFQKEWDYVKYVIIIFLVIAFFQLRKEAIVGRRKTILLNYLKKGKRRSIYHLSKEWDAKKDFTEKNIDDLLLRYPDVFKRVKVRRNKRYVSGVGLVSNATGEEIKESE